MASHMENENENENEDVNDIENTVKGADFLRIFFDEKCVIRVGGKEQTICTLYGMVFLGRWDEILPVLFWEGNLSYAAEEAMGRASTEGRARAQEEGTCPAETVERTRNWSADVQ